MFVQSKQLVFAKTPQPYAHRPITTYHVHAKSCMEEMHKFKGQQKPTKWFFFSSHVEIYIFLTAVLGYFFLLGLDVLSHRSRAQLVALGHGASSFAACTGACTEGEIYPFRRESCFPLLKKASENIGRCLQ